MTTTWPISPGPLRADPVDQGAVDDAQQRAGEHRQRHHEAFGGRIELEIGGDLHA